MGAVRGEGEAARPMRRVWETIVGRRLGFALVVCATLALLAPAGAPRPAPDAAHAGTVPAGFQETTVISAASRIRRLFASPPTGASSSPRRAASSRSSTASRTRRRRCSPTSARTSTTSGTAACSGWRSHPELPGRRRTSTSSTRYDHVGDVGSRAPRWGARGELDRARPRPGRRPTAAWSAAASRVSRRRATS